MNGALRVEGQSSQRTGNYATRKGRMMTELRFLSKTITVMLVLAIAPALTAAMGAADGASDIAAAVRQNPADRKVIDALVDRVLPSSELALALAEEAREEDVTEAAREVLRRLAVATEFRTLKTVGSEKSRSVDLCYSLVQLMKESAHPTERDGIAVSLRLLFDASLLSNYLDDILDTALKDYLRDEILLYGSLPNAATASVYALTNATGDVVLQGLRCRYGDTDAEARVLAALRDWPAISEHKEPLYMMPPGSYTRDIVEAIRESRSSRIHREVALGTRSTEMVLGDEEVWPKASFYVHLLMKLHVGDPSFPFEKYRFDRSADVVSAVEQWCAENLGVTYPDDIAPDINSMWISAYDESEMERFGFRLVRPSSVARD